MSGTEKEEIVIGKDILELLSTAMYAEPLSIFREYVQNAVDSIDEAEQAGLYNEGDPPRIDIYQDPLARSVSIRDNGTGLAKHLFKRRLTSFGDSKKRGTNARGFRGVGRLAGLGYCRELVFRSRCQGVEKVSELRWDCVKLKQLLMDPECRDNLATVVNSIIDVSHDSDAKEDDPPRFFEVIMQKVVRIGKDTLLNEQLLETYLSQVAPVPFHPDFTLGKIISEKLQEKGLGQTYSVNLQGRTMTPVYRCERNEIQISESLSTSFVDIKWIEIPDIEEGLMAFGWILHSEYLGAYPVSSGLGGIRLRVGNIQVGRNRLLDGIFQEPRFNQWIVGELHIISTKLLPNGRRDDFENNIHYDHLKSSLSTDAHEVSKFLRKTSSIRNLLRNSLSVRLSAEKLWDESIQLGIENINKSKLIKDLNTIARSIDTVMVDNDYVSKYYYKKLKVEKKKVLTKIKVIEEKDCIDESSEIYDMDVSLGDIWEIIVCNCNPELCGVILSQIRSKLI